MPPLRRSFEKVARAPRPGEIVPDATPHEPASAAPARSLSGSNFPAAIGTTWAADPVVLPPIPEADEWLTRGITIMEQPIEPAQKLKELVMLIVPALTDCCALYHLRRNGNLIRVAAADANCEGWEHELSSPVPGATWNPLARSLQEAQTHFTFIGQDDFGGHASALSAYLIIPLARNERVTGAMVLGMGESQRRFNTRLVTLAHQYAAKAAEVLDWLKATPSPALKQFISPPDHIRRQEDFQSTH